MMLDQSGAVDATKIGNTWASTPRRLLRRIRNEAEQRP